MSEQQPPVPEKPAATELESAIQDCYSTAVTAFETQGDFVGRLFFSEIMFGIETLILTGPQQQTVRLARVLQGNGVPIDRCRIEVVPYQDKLCTTHMLWSSGEGTQKVAWDSDVFEWVGTAEKAYDALLLGRLTPEEKLAFWAQVEHWLADCAALVQAANFAEGVGLQDKPIESAEEMRALTAFLGACVPAKRQ